MNKIAYSKSCLCVTGERQAVLNTVRRPVELIKIFYRDQSYMDTSSSISMGVYYVIIMICK